MNPPPPGPVKGLSVTHEAKPAATQASTAFPPRSRVRAPTSAVSGWPAAIAPFMDRAYVPIGEERAHGFPQSSQSGATVGPSRWAPGEVAVDASCIHPAASDVSLTMLRQTLDKRTIVLAALGMAALAVVVLSPQLFQRQVLEALAALEDANAGFLWLATARVRRGPRLLGLRVARGDPPARPCGRVRAVRGRFARELADAGPRR